MKVNVDFSIFTGDGEAVGHIDGEIDLVVVPMQGDTISMMFAPDGVAAPPGHEFGAQLKVADRILCPNQIDGGITIVLSDMVVATKEQAIAFISYFVASYGLHANPY